MKRTIERLADSDFFMTGLYTLAIVAFTVCVTAGFFSLGGCATADKAPEWRWELSGKDVSW